MTSWLLTRLALTLVVVINFADAQSATPPVQSPARPTLQFEKTRFVVGERVFFWVGVEVPGQKVPVPRELQDSLRVIFTRPDGTERIDRVSFPIDGMGINSPGDLGFRGGRGLGAEIPQLGSWIVVAEFAGARTQPVTFTVENVPILKDIEAAFVFSSPLILNSPEATATLTVRNKSTEVIRFVELGQNNSHVSVNLTKTTGEAWGASFFVPSAVLSAASGHKIVPMSVDVFTWAETKRFPTVTLSPGADFHLRLPIAKAMEAVRSSSGIPAGEYDVTFSTELQLLVGEAGGNWKDFAPIRLAATSTTQGTVVGQAPAATPQVSREAAWLEDLDAFAREFAARQIDFSKLYPRARFDNALEQIRKDLPAISDADVVLSLMRLVASARVAHTLVRPPSGRLAFRRLPLVVSWYGNDLAVTSALEPYRAALGLRVVRIGRLLPVSLEREVAPYISYELDPWLRVQSPSFMMIYELLARLGQTEADGRVKLTLERTDGTRFEMDVEPGPWQGGPPLVTAVDALKIPTPLFRSRPGSFYWFERLADRRALYIQYNRCADDPARPFATFATELFTELDAHATGIERVIVDLRQNSGGDSRIIQPLIKGLRDRKAFRERGRLIALVGPATFSSGLLAALDLQNADAILMGEPPGEALDSYGEVRPYTLPQSGLLIQYSTKFFKLSKKGADLLQPDFVVIRSLADALAGRDPVLDAALAYRR